MTPQNKFKAIVAVVFGGFILLVVVSLMLINGNKPKNTEQVVTNNVELNENVEAEKNSNANSKIISNVEPKAPNPNAALTNLGVQEINSIDKQNSQNNISQTGNINTAVTNPVLANSQNLNNVNNLNNLNIANTNLNPPNPSLNPANLPSQIISPQSLEIAKLQQRISDLEAKIAKQNNMNHSNINHTNKTLHNLHSSKSTAVKNNHHIHKQDEQQAVLAVVGDRAWVKNSNNGIEYNVAKGEKLQNGDQVKYIDNVNDVIIHSSTH